MIVKDIMSRKVISLSSKDSVQKLISLMEKNHIHEVPVIDDKKLVGIVQAKRLTETSVTNPNKTKVKSLIMSAPAMLNPEQDIDSAAKLILETGLRALPVVEKKKVIGLLSLHDIVNEISKTKDFRQTKAETLMSETVTISDNTDIGKTRVMMRDYNISRVPIVDGAGKLKGIITTFDMLKSVKPRERMSWYSMAAEMDRIMQIPISTIMNKRPVTADPESSLTNIVDLMNRHNTSGIVITSRGYPKGIIVLKDLLEFYVSGLKKKGIYYQIVGVADEDDFIIDIVDRMIQETLQKVQSVYNVLFLFVHVKKHNVEIKGKTKYSVRVRLKTDKKIFISKAWEWDLRTAIDQALDQIERAVFKDKKLKKDRFKRNILRLKRTFRRR